MVEVLKTGLYDTIQDLGRKGYQQYGVPISGVMDRYSAELANAILGNAANAAVIESVYTGPQLKFQSDTLICITGAHMNATLNSDGIKMNTAISVQKGDVLNFGSLSYGCRTYISVLGGFLTETCMNSRSMYKGVTTSIKLNKGMNLSISEENKVYDNSFATIKIVNKHFETNELEVFKGPEFDRLSVEHLESLLHFDFTIAQTSNRMAYQFEERIENSLNGIITSLVLPGTVQLTPSGQLIVLMRDCQTTGGYPRILQLTEASIDRLSQKIVGAKFRLKRLN